jgi:hypothetical protein
MDALTALGRLGQVQPADPAVVDAALERLEAAIGQDRPLARTSARAGRRRPWLVTTAAAAVAVTAAAAAFVVVTQLDRPAAPTRSAGASLAAHGKSVTGPAGFAGATSSGPRAIAAVLTAFRASADDILAVTKTMRGDFGTVGPTIIWVSPAQAAPGSTVRSRILALSPRGALRMGQWLTYTATSTVAPSAANGNCAAIFARPRVVYSPATGVPGTLMAISYFYHWWTQGAVTVQAATVPSAAALRACLKSGQWSVTGRRVVQGTRVVEMATPSPGGYERLWVSAATFLPVRLVFGGPNVDTITFMFRFLPPTAANEAVLATPPAPAGFRRMSF